MRHRLDNMLVELLLMRPSMKPWWCFGKPLRTNGVKHLQQKRSQNILRRHRWPPRVRVQPVELIAQGDQNRVRQLANRSQRVILWHSLFQRNIAEHPILYPLISTHVRLDEHTCRPVTERTAYFNKFLVLLCYKVDSSDLISLAEEIVG